MHLCVPLPPERPNRLHLEVLWCLGAGNAPRTPRQQLKPSGLMHPNDDACVQSVPSRPCIFVSSYQQRESEQTAPRDALVFGSWQCITYAAKCNIEQFALPGLVHPHSDACVQTMLPRSCIYVSPCLLRGRTGCTMRCFGAWELAMHQARRGSSSSLRG